MLKETTFSCPVVHLPYLKIQFDNLLRTIFYQPHCTTYDGCLISSDIRSFGLTIQGSPDHGAVSKSDNDQVDASSVNSNVHTRDHVTSTRGAKKLVLFGCHRVGALGNVMVYRNVRIELAFSLKFHINTSVNYIETLLCISKKIIVVEQDMTIAVRDVE